MWNENILGEDSDTITTVEATVGTAPYRPQEVSYIVVKPIGNGSFGVVYKAKLCDTGELVAIKNVLHNERYKVSFKKSRRTESTVIPVFLNLKDKSYESTLFYILW